MPDAKVVTQHYTHGGLLAAIRDGVEKLGKSIRDVTVEDLAPVDEFHIGGRGATETFLDQLGITGDHHVLDVGCGLGGGCRFAAQKYGCRVTGVDLTPEYVETGNVLCRWVGLSPRIRLEVEDATALPHPDGAFDRAFLMHVGMNVADKESLAAELHRVLRPGGRLGIYDIMHVGEGDLDFPVPWATEPGGSSVTPPEAYRSALESAGFRIVAERDRRDFALGFFAQVQARAGGGGGPPPLGLHILMGDAAPVKYQNMIENVSRNLVAPVEIFAEKSAWAGEPGRALGCEESRRKLMALKITGPDDWTRLSRLGGPVVDPMVLRCGELFLHGARGVENPDAAWALLTKNVHALAVFFDRLILDDQIPVFDYADTFDAEQNFSQRTFGKVNQEDEILVEVNVAWEAYDTVKRAALAEVEKLYSSDAGVDARLAKSILDELSTSGYAWFPQLGDLAFRSADEQRLASFILGGLIFGAYAQLAGTEHLLQPKRSELFLAVSLRQPGLHSVDRRLFERLGQLAGQATAEVPYTPTFFPLLLHLSEGPADVLSNALEIRKSAEAGDYRQWWRDTLLEFKESGRIPVAREREAQRIAEAVERKQKGLPIPKVAVKTTVADVAAGGAPGVAVDFTDPAKALWGWCVGMLPGKRHRKLLTRAVIADREYVELDRRVKTVWSGEGVRV